MASPQANQNTNNTHTQSRKSAIALLFLYSVMGTMTFLNLLFSNTIPGLETCGLIHPVVFQAQVNFINPDTNANFNTGLQGIPIDVDSEPLDTFLRVYGESPLTPNAIPLVSNDDALASARRVDSVIYNFENRTAERQTYFVEVGTFADSREGTYILSVQSASIPTEIPEIAIGEEIQGKLLGGESARFIISGTGAAVDIRVRGTTLDSLDLDTILTIYDSSNQIIAENDDGLGVFSVIDNFTTPRDGYLIIEIDGLNEEIEANYTLSVMPAAQTPEMAMGDSLSGTLVQFNTESNSEFPVYTRDSYVINMEAETPVSIRVSSDFDSYLRLYDAQGTLINFDDDSAGDLNAAIASFSVSEAQAIIIEVASYADSEGGDYTVSILPPPPPPEISGTIAADDTIEGDLEPGEKIRYALPVEAGNSYSFAITSDFDSFLRIFDENDNILSLNDDYGDSVDAAITFFAVPDDQTVIVEVASFADAEGGTYALTIESFESEGISETVELGTVSGDLVEGNRASYQFVAQANQAYAFTVSSNFDSYLRVYDATGAEIAGNDDFIGFDAAITNFSVSDEQTIRIEVASFADSESGSFELAIEEAEAIEATAIGLGDDVDGSISPGERVLYDVFVEVGTRYDFIISSNFDSVLFINDANGAQIEYSDDTFGSDAAVMDFVPDQSGTLTLTVAAFDPADSGEFTLSVDVSQRSEQIEIDSNLDEGDRADYLIDVEADMLFSVFLESDFDTYLRIYDEDDEILFENDDFNGLDAGQFGLSVDQDQQLRVEVASYEDEQEGEYTIIFEAPTISEDDYVIIMRDIEEVEEPTPETTVTSQDTFVPPTINELIDIFTTARVYTDSTILVSNTRQPYRFSPRANQLYDITVNGSFDSVLRIYDAFTGEELYFNDDFASPLNAGFYNFNMPTNTDILIEVGALEDQDGGEYTLTVAPSPNRIEVLGDIEVDAEEPIRRAISANSRDVYRLELRPNEDVDIILRGVESDFNLGRVWRRFTNNRGANSWAGCLEYYGTADSGDSIFNIDPEGFSRFVLGRKIPLPDECLEGVVRSDISELFRLFLNSCGSTTTISLTALGRVLFFVILPGLAILLPIITVAVLEDDETVWWLFGLSLVAIYVLTSSLLYLHLGEVSAIVALQEFAYGLFGGTATGAAIAFIGKALENFSSRSTEVEDYQESVVALVSAIRNEGIPIIETDAPEDDDLPPTEEV